MAQRVIQTVIYTDDLTGEEFTEGQGGTVSYGLDGAVYEIDLSLANEHKFRQFFEPYLEASRKVVDVRGRTLASAGGGGTKGKKRSREEMLAIREWARGNGYEVGTNGRLPWHMVQAYDKAHPEQAAPSSLRAR